MKQTQGYEFDFSGKRIIVSKAYLKAAGTIGSAAYNELAQLRRDYSDFAIEQRQITKKQGKKTYGKLTYERMAEHIKAKEGNSAITVIAEFERIKQLSKVHSGQYAFVKTWFLNRYKDDFQQEEIEEAMA